MSKNQEYAEKYAGYAMEQMRRYGIPASVTLAQGILESSNGQSRLAQNENNHFGIKATPSWIDEGGRYALYSDDRPDEKFCSYDSVGDSYEHHSRFLKENSRYAACFNLSPDDYKGWTEGIAQAGYATGSDYAGKLQKIIEQNGLQEYDRQVMQEMKEQGRCFGLEENPLGEAEDTTYSFPVERKDFLFVTTPFGVESRSSDSGEKVHKGMDIRCNDDSLLATENGGKVISVKGSGAGQSVTVEYSRKDGSKVQCSYMHLGEVSVKVGDTVKAGQQLGKSGEEHLHFSVRNIYADGTQRDIDPAAYLAEIAQKGGIRQQVLHNGNDLLARYKSPDSVRDGRPLTTEGWMKKLLSSEDSGVGLSGCSDPVVEMAMTAFTSLMLLAVQIDNKEEERQKAEVSAAMDSRKIDLKPLLPGMKSCTLTINENGKALLHADNGSVQISRELSSAELSRLSVTLNNGSLSEETKRMRVIGLLNTVILSETASRNFEMGMEQQQGQTESLKR